MLGFPRRFQRRRLDDPSRCDLAGRRLDLSGAAESRELCGQTLCVEGVPAVAQLIVQMDESGAHSGMPHLAEELALGNASALLDPQAAVAEVGQKAELPVAVIDHDVVA